MGMFANSKPSKETSESIKTQYKRAQSKKPEKEYEENMDNLEEPDFDEEEMMRVGEIIRKRQQEALKNR